MDNNNWLKVSIYTTPEGIEPLFGAILSMGIYELVYTDTPEIVSINEAVELANMYSDEKVKNMINAVLDSIYHGEDNE